MDIIKRNFFRLLRSGALNEFVTLEPMSSYKWRRLAELVRAQRVTDMALRGIKNHQYDVEMNMAPALIAELQGAEAAVSETPAQLSSRFLNRRLKRIRENEPHVIDASMDTVEILNIIVRNVVSMLNRGISLNEVMELGRFLRTRGQRVDFVKLDDWLSELHLQNMAQLIGSILIEVFEFSQDEVPFVGKLEPDAQKLTLRTINHAAIDTAKEWHFRQRRSGFVKSNSAVLRRNLRRSIRYIPYAPLETTSNFFSNFARSLSEIEE